MSTKTMVMSDGGLASLVALAMASEEAVAVGSRGSGPVELVGLVRSRSRQSTHQAQEFAVQAQARAMGVPVIGGVLSPLPDDADPSRGESATIELVTAAYFALRSGCSRLVWPVHVDRAMGDAAAFDHAAEACDRALLVSRLVLLDAAGAEVPEVSVMTPLVDFSDEQLAELAIDLAVPMPTLWWWKGEYASDHARYERERWMAALEAVGGVLPVGGSAESPPSP